jgi:hypothetical protein
LVPSMPIPSATTQTCSPKCTPSSINATRSSSASGLARLKSVVQGYLAYYAVPGNTDAVAAFRTQVGRHWYKALRRRSQRTRLNWARMDRITKRWLPPARPRHPFPIVSNRALRRQNPRQEPSAVIPHAGICAGGRPQGRSLPRTIHTSITQLSTMDIKEALIRSSNKSLLDRECTPPGTRT